MKKMISHKVFQFFLFVPGFVFLTFCGSGKRQPHEIKETECWENLIAEHAGRYPEMEIGDLYKLIYQSTLGSGHAVSDTAMVKEWLEKDIAGLDTSTEIPLIDTLGKCGRYVRIHLKPFLEQGGDKKKLMEVFISTGMDIKPDSVSFFNAMNAAVLLAEKNKLPWTAAEVKNYFSERAMENYPAVHHSDAYQGNYHPAYRVIYTGFISRLEVNY